MGIQLNGSSGADIISSSDGTLTIDGTSTVSTPIVTNTITISDKISHTGDSNTHIRFAGDDTVTVETAGSERIRINSSGKVGIGTNLPVGSLDVRDSKANLIVAKDGLTVKNTSDIATSYDLIQLGAGGALASYSTATVTADTQFIHNAYRHSGNNWKYRYADTAARLRVNSPARTWIFESAGSGSANGDITWSEQLRIDSNGDLRVAASTDLSSPNTGYKRIVIGNNLIFNAGSSAGGYTGFQNNAYVNSGGNWVRVNNDHASSIGMDDGNIYFRNTGAGTGNISWNMPLQIASDGKITVGANSDIRFTNGTWTGEVAGKIQHNSNNLYIQGGSGGIRFRHHSSGVNQFSMTNGGNFEINNGDVVVANGHGINFSATSDGPSVGSETFDDYERGGWTGVITTGGGNVGNAWYIKIGDMVFVTGNCTAWGNTTSSNAIQVTGLPFTANATGYGQVVFCKHADAHKGCWVEVNGTTLQFLKSSTSTGSCDYMYHSGIVQSSGSASFSVWYRTAA